MITLGLLIRHHGAARQRGPSAEATETAASAPDPDQTASLSAAADRSDVEQRFA
jgi:hypothetical protein